jgi:hypothetical protein
MWEDDDFEAKHITQKYEKRVQTTNAKRIRLDNNKSLSLNHRIKKTYFLSDIGDSGVVGDLCKSFTVSFKYSLCLDNNQAPTSVFSMFSI